jgi:hypothetical protein
LAQGSIAGVASVFGAAWVPFFGATFLAGAAFLVALGAAAFFLVILDIVRLLVAMEMAAIIRPAEPPADDARKGVSAYSA